LEAERRADLTARLATSGHESEAHHFRTALAVPETSFLLQMARQVAEDESMWRSALKNARSERFIGVRLISMELPNAIMACLTGRPLAEEPTGFIASDLLFEMMRTLEPYFRGDVARFITSETVGAARKILNIQKTPKIYLMNFPPGSALLFAEAIFRHPLQPGRLSPLALEVCDSVLDEVRTQSRGRRRRLICEICRQIVVRWGSEGLRLWWTRTRRGYAIAWIGDRLVDIAGGGIPIGHATGNPLTTSRLRVTARARLARGRHLLALERIDEATGEFSRVLALARWRSIFRRRLSSFNSEVRARASFWRDEALASALLGKAEISERQGLPALAVKHLQRARDILQERFERSGDRCAAREWRRIEARLLQLREDSEARSRFRRTLRDIVSYAALARFHLSIHRAQTFAARGAFAKADRKLTRALERHSPRPGGPAREIFLTRAYIDRGHARMRTPDFRQYEAARRDFEAAERLNDQAEAPKNLPYRAEIDLGKGLTYFGQHLFDAADWEFRSSIASCQSALQQELPDDVRVTVRSFLVTAQLNWGNVAYERATGPTDVRLNEAKQRYQSARDDLDALAASEGAVIDRGLRALITTYLARTLARQGHYEVADEEFQKALSLYQDLILKEGRRVRLGARKLGYLAARYDCGRRRNISQRRDHHPPRATETGFFR
jgi:tetratricopeptide (TPR) repeat protein